MRRYPSALAVLPLALVIILGYSTVAAQNDSLLGTDDSGFRPDVNGFSFQNYGSELSVVDLTPVEMQRMFGDQVCASTSGGECVLTHPAKRWMDQAIKAMSYGHCEGIAVLSDLIYFNQKNPSDFGGEQAVELSLDNELLQREIGYWWVTQVTTPGGSNKVFDSPNAVLDVLIEAFKMGSDAREWWVMGIYQPDGSAGHSVTPYAVEDRGNGSYRIYVYDNNWPKEVRYVTVDQKTNTWSYSSSINPNEPSQLYAGNASTKSLEVVSVSSRLDKQQCDFCLEENQSDLNGSKGALPSEKKVQVWQSGMASVLVTDDQGRRIGLLPTGQFVNEIPGAEIRKLRFDSDYPVQPVIFVPVSSESRPRINVTTISSDANDSAPNQAETAIIAPGFAAASSIPDLGPGQLQNLDLNLGEGEDGYNLRISGNQIETPTISIDSDLKSVTIRGASLEPDGSINLNINPVDDSFSMSTIDNSNPGTIQIDVSSIDWQTGEQFSFSRSDVVLEQNDDLSIDFSDSSQDRDTFSLSVIHEDGDVERFDLQSMSEYDLPEPPTLSIDEFPDLAAEEDIDYSEYYQEDTPGPSGIPETRFPR